MKTTIFGLALIGQQLHCSALILSAWLICRGLSGPFSLKICSIQRTDWDFLKLETLKKNILPVCWMLVNPFYIIWPQKIEYVLSYPGRCFRPEACFYGLFLPSGGWELWRDQILRLSWRLNSGILRDWIANGCFSMGRMVKTGWCPTEPHLAAGGTLQALGFRGFSWSLRLPKHEDCCWALRVPPLTEMWCSAESPETFPPLVPCLRWRNATFPQTGKMFSSVTQIPENNALESKG